MKNINLIFHQVRQEKLLQTYNVSPEVNVGEFFVDVFDGGLHGFICQDRRPLLWVCTALRHRRRYRCESVMSLHIRL